MADQAGYFSFTEFSDLGLLLVGGRIYTYAYGTTTHKVAYTDAAGVIPQTYVSDGIGGLYIALNARGELPAPLYLTSGSYDIALKTPAGVTIRTRRADPIDFRSVYSADGGSDLIGTIQSGTGADGRTVQSKLRDIVTVKDFGAVVDGSTDDRTDVNAAFAAHPIITGVEGTAIVNGTLLLTATSVMQGGKYQAGASDPAEFVVIPINATGVTINDATIMAGTGIGIHQNRANNSHVFINNPRVSSAGFCILSNELSDGGDGFVINVGQLTSSGADAVNFNHPGAPTALGTNYHYSCIGSILESGNFAFSVSGTLGWSIIGTHVRSSTLEAFHVEHSQRRGIIALNTARQCVKNGIHILPNISGDPYSDPVIALGNHLNHSGAVVDEAGWVCISNAQGQEDSEVCVGNVFTGFYYGVSAPLEPHLVDNNVLQNCVIAVDAERSSYLSGTNISKTCTNHVVIGAAATVDRIIIENRFAIAAAPSILVHSDGRGTGGKAKGFWFRIGGSHTGGAGAENVILFACGANTRMRGTLSVQMDRNATGIFYSAVVHWDGATLTVGSATVDNEIEQYAGGYSAGIFNQSAGNVRFNFVSSIALTDEIFIVDFDGTIFQV